VALLSGVRHRWAQQPRPLRAHETLGNGCAFIDYDRDGWQDILLVDKPRVALFRNLGNGKFENVTAQTELQSIQGYWMGCAVGDYNGDGFLDVLLTGYHRLCLLQNQAGKRWSDVTLQSGLKPDNAGHWSTGAGFMDLDRNGTLDLVLLHYIVFGPKEKQYCERITGLLTGCRPNEYRAEYPELWKNTGQGTFRHLPGSLNPENVSGKALVIAFTDVNRDQLMDFYIGNDGTPSDLMLNKGNLRFKNIGRPSGVAVGANGLNVAAMGADWGDYDRDGKEDLAISAFTGETFPLLRSQGSNIWQHAGFETGIAASTLKNVGWGTKWLDMDNDGWPDLAFANGHVFDNAEKLDPLDRFLQPLMLFHNVGSTVKRRFVDLVPQSQGSIRKPILGRGLATGDYDNDGRVDILVVDYEGEPLLLRNVWRTDNHWITFDLRARGTNQFAYGARISARAGKHLWTKQVSPAGSYLSSSDTRVHFGLGAISSLDNVTINWPDGRRQVLRRVRADRVITVHQQ
jgi:hypothetical protein